MSFDLTMLKTPTWRKQNVSYRVVYDTKGNKRVIIDKHKLSRKIWHKK